MSRNTKRPLSKPMMIRIPESMKDDLETIAASNDLSVSAVVRLAVKKHLPAMKSGRATFSTGA